MDYGKLISRAARITIRHRFLWLLGILASGSGLNFGYSGDSGGDYAEPLPEVLRQALDWFSAHLYVAILLAVIFFLVVIFFIVISIMANGGLIASVAEIERRQPVSFMAAMKAGYHVFWRLVGLGILIVLGIMSPIVFSALPIVALVLAEHYLAAVAVGLILLPIIIVVAIYLGLVLIYAQRFAVVQAAGVIASLTSAHHLLFSFKKEVLLVWLIAIALGIGISFASVLVIILIALPSVALGALIYTSLGLIPTLAFALIPALVLLAAVLLMTGISGAFQSSYWTLAYLDLTKISPPPLPQPAA
ncbi:MAG: hypothetical protein JSV79_03280 [Armatimonadota bacterium]|nr:MAG: hypothetical protein JSV79_03280 [Armatimonadota bacterium]